MVKLNLDDDGFLLEPETWTPELARHMAHGLGIVLEESHWHVINCARQFYAEHQLSPAMRALVNRLKSGPHADLANTLTLSALFPESLQAHKGGQSDPITDTKTLQLPVTHITRGSPAKRIAGVAGLPRPTNCL